MSGKRSLALVLGIWVAAIAAQANAQVSRVAYDYTAMYEALNPSIVKVHSDFGSGSGFLVDNRGMIATNHHVVRNARYLAVEFSDGRKVVADLVFLDPRNDLALLKVNNTTVSQLAPVPILPARLDSTVKAGIPVVAFGSPLSQTFLMTQGIVSKVEPSVLLGDFLIQHGNSGGPLVNLDGHVIGINTFAEEGIAGAVRVNVLREALSKPEVASYSGEEPPATELPAVERSRFPTDVLKERILRDPLDISSYKLDGGRFTITAITPILLGKLQVQADLQQAANRYSRRGKKIKDATFDPVDEPFYDWYRNATQFLDSVVTFEVKPDFGQTSGSAWASALSAFADGMARRPTTPTHQTMEFKAEFQELRLFRDGVPVQPITPGRQITEQSVSNGMMTFVDEAYSGWYVYSPSVFMTGNQFRLDVYDAREPGRIHKSIVLTESSKVLQQIRKDFAGAVK